MKKEVLLEDCGIAKASKGERHDAFVCAWYLTNRPTLSRHIYFEEVAGLAQGIVEGALGSHFGGIVGLVADLKGFNDAVSVLNSEGLYDRFDRAVRAGVMDSVRGTSDEFAYRMSEGLLFGFAAIVCVGKYYRIDLLYTNHKKHFLSLLGAAEGRGRKTQSSYQYMRGLCKQASWEYNDENGVIMKKK